MVSQCLPYPYLRFIPSTLLCPYLCHLSRRQILRPLFQSAAILLPTTIISLARRSCNRLVCPFKLRFPFLAILGVCFHRRFRDFIEKTHLDHYNYMMLLANTER
jgi:hypothetical protein